MFGVLLLVGAGGATVAAGPSGRNDYGSEVTPILDGSGGGVAPLRGPRGMDTDAAGNLYVAGQLSHNVLRVSPSGAVQVVISSDGDGRGNKLRAPRSVAVSAKGTVVVAGEKSGNAFRISPEGEVELIYPTAKQKGLRLVRPTEVALDAAGNAYIMGQSSNNVLRVAPDGTTRQMIGKRGDGTHDLRRPNALAVSDDGVVYVAGARTNNVFRVPPSGKTTQIVDRLGPHDGHGLLFPVGLAVDGAGNVYVAGNNSGNVLKVDPEGTVTIVALPSRDGRPLSACSDIVTTADGTVYFARVGTHSLWRLSPDGDLEEILDKNVAGTGELLKAARGVAVDTEGHVFVSGFGSDNVFKVVPPPLAPAPASGS